MDNTNSAKLRIKLGAIELEYEGPSEFLHDELIKTFEKLLELQDAHKVLPHATEGEGSKSGSTTRLELAPNTVAARMNCKTTTDLVLAMCVYLHFVEQKSTFSRQDIHDAMKKASTYYKENDRKNLSSSLETLIKKGTVLERSQGNFALHADAIKQYEVSLAS